MDATQKDRAPSMACVLVLATLSVAGLLTARAAYNDGDWSMGGLVFSQGSGGSGGSGGYSIRSGTPGAGGTPGGGGFDGTPGAPGTPGTPGGWLYSGPAQNMSTKTTVPLIFFMAPVAAFLYWFSTI